MNHAGIRGGRRVGRGGGWGEAGVGGKRRGGREVGGRGGVVVGVFA